MGHLYHGELLVITRGYTVWWAQQKHGFSKGSSFLLNSSDLVKIESKRCWWKCHVWIPKPDFLVVKYHFFIQSPFFWLSLPISGEFPSPKTPSFNSGRWCARKGAAEKAAGEAERLEDSLWVKTYEIAIFLRDEHPWITALPALVWTLLNTFLGSEGYSRIRTKRNKPENICFWSTSFNFFWCFQIHHELSALSCGPWLFVSKIATSYTTCDLSILKAG